MDAARVHVEATVTITRLPWRSRTFEHMFADETLARLCTASVANICAFIVDTHRTVLAKMVRCHSLTTTLTRAVRGHHGGLAAVPL